MAVHPVVWLPSFRVAVKPMPREITATAMPLPRTIAALVIPLLFQEWR
jgi:hypothetical protein